jgi:capsular exopolysaccharide synthesis family protein
MAQAGLSVIVVDSDLRRPALHKFFGVDNKQGLTDALLQSTPNLDGYLQGTAIENLQVLASGPLPPNPSELLGSQRMRDLVGQLKGKADVLLFDSPPVLAVTDAAVLANQVDGVLLIVDAGATRREAASRARETMAKVGASLLGVALNKLSAKGAGGYYYYYYYSSEGEGKERRRRKRSRGTATGVVGAIRRWVANLPSRGRSG